MKIQSFVATVALAAVVSLPAAMSASTIKSPVHAVFSKPHKVSLTLSNDSQQPLTLKAGEQDVTIQPGKTAALKLFDGDTIVTEAASGTHAAGEVILVATSDVNNATLHIH